MQSARKLLIVDDDPLSSEVLSVLLSASGYAIELADDGDEALARVEDSNFPDIILTDLQMPGITGNALAEALRATCGSQTLLLAMSGTEPEPETVSSFAGFLLKPFTPEQLNHLIETGFSAVNSPEVKETVLLDDVIYARLQQVMTQKQIADTYDLCLNDALSRITRMQTLRNQPDAFRREAHTIKGGCAMLGAVELQEMARRMEANGPKDVDAERILKEFPAAAARLRRILESH